MRATQDSPTTPKFQKMIIARVLGSCFFVAQIRFYKIVSVLLQLKIKILIYTNRNVNTFLSKRFMSAFWAIYIFFTINIKSKQMITTFPT